MRQQIQIKTPWGAASVAVVTCDQCGEQSTFETMLNWIFTQALGPQLAVDPPEPNVLTLDFCCPKCVVVYYTTAEVA